MCMQVALLATCVKKGINVLSATGAGARADPTRVRIADLSESSTDPLSRSVSSSNGRKSCCLPTTLDENITTILN